MLVTLALAGAMGLSGAVTAHAQRGASLLRFRPAVGEGSFLTVQGPETPKAGVFNFQWSLDWAVDPLSVGRDDAVVIGHQVVGRFQAQVGLADRLSLAVEAPWVLYQATDASPLGDGAGALPSSAAGNPRLVLRGWLSGERLSSGASASQARWGFALAATAPAGRTDAFSADDAWLLESTVLLDYRLLGAGLGVSLGTRFRLDGNRERVVDAELSHEMELGVALLVPTFVLRDVFGLLEFRWIASLTDAFGFSGQENLVEGNLGLRVRSGDVAVTAAVGTELAPGYGSAAFRGFVSVSWSPQAADADDDGVPDAEDDCVYLGEDLDGFEDADGCPDPDNDGDLVVDEEDLCPEEAPEPYEDENEDGCIDLPAPVSPE